MFEPGQYIHHSSNGLCRVEEITRLEMAGADKDRLYYKIIPADGRGSVIYTPVDNPKVEMRPAMTRAQAEQLIHELPLIEEMEVPDEKHREQLYKEALASVDCRSWGGLLKTLYARRQKRTMDGKKVTATEERYYQAALARINMEIAHAMEIPADEIEKYISGLIEQGK